MEMRRRWWTLVVAVLVLAASAPPASAAFPGANGQLALTPMSGNGVILASPVTGHGHRVCDAPQTCGRAPAEARFSPNGRELVVRAGGRLAVTTVAGTCVWCATSTPRVTIGGSDPVFTPGGLTITYVNRGVWEIAPGRPNPTRLRVIYGPATAGNQRVSAVAWGPSNKAVAVRHGWLWTGDRKGNALVLFTRLTRGSAPAWSPDGRELAFTRKGFVFTIETATHKIARIARGTSPAFSPHRRSLAYLSPSHQVTITPIGHGRTRILSRLRGRSLDWQPVTAITRRGCATANGVAVASTSTATIRQAANPHRGHVGWNGCLKDVGIPFHLNGGQQDMAASLALGHAALAGPFAALQFIYTDKYLNYTDTINVYDLRSGELIHSTDVPCQIRPCDVSALAVNPAGFAAWHAVDTAQRPRRNFLAISCPTTGLCVAGDDAGDLLVSTSPAAGPSASTRVTPAGATGVIASASCPTAGFCVAVTLAGTAYWSSDPTGGPSAWHPVTLTGSGLVRISCGSATLCVAVGDKTAYVTTDPSGPASAWTPHQLPTAGVLDAVSCAANALCVIGDDSGALFTSTDPVNAAPSWTTAQVSGGISDVDCATTGFCAAIGRGSGGGAVISTTDPAANAWTAHAVDGIPFSVTCAGTALCLAYGVTDLLTSTNPADASPSWTDTASGQGLQAASCPATNLCVAAAGSNILTSADPTAGASAWSSAVVDVLPCDPCLSETLTAVDDHGTHTLDTAPPGSGTHVADLGFTGNTLTWTHDGVARSAGLS